MIRSTTSIPANIAEGYGGAGGHSFRNYLVISRRSAHETDYWLPLSHELGYISSENYRLFADQVSEVVAILTAIVNKLSPKSPATPDYEDHQPESPDS